jgi:RNA polymerase sigma-70 factor (ECF subfamily)
MVRDMAAGDQAAVGRLYGALAPRLYAVAHRILRDGTLAEDAVQEAFIKIWRNAGRFDSAKGTVAAWAAVITRRTALDRKPKAVFTALPELEAPAPDPDYLHPRLKSCLQALPPEHRNALVLMYVYGLSHSELAQALGAPLGTVKSWARRGGSALKESLQR